MYSETSLFHGIHAKSHKVEHFKCSLFLQVIRSILLIIDLQKNMGSCFPTYITCTTSTKLNVIL